MLKVKKKGVSSGTKKKGTTHGKVQRRQKSMVQIDIKAYFSTPSPPGPLHCIHFNCLTLLSIAVWAPHIPWVVCAFSRLSSSSCSCHHQTIYLYMYKETGILIGIINSKNNNNWSLLNSYEYLVSMYLCIDVNSLKTIGEFFSPHVWENNFKWILSWKKRFPNMDFKKNFMLDPSVTSVRVPWGWNLTLGTLNRPGDS